MKRLIFAVLAIPCVALAIDPQLMPDPLYEPKIGDLCVIGFFDTQSKTCSDVEAWKDESTYQEYWKALLGNDETKRKAIEASGRMIEIKAGTRAELLKQQTYPVRDPRPDAANLRPNHGPYKNQSIWIARSDILRKAENSRPTTEATNARAVSLLKSGQNLEKRGKKASAIESYGRVMTDFPDTPEAKTAEERIKALGGEVPAKRETKAKADTSPSASTGKSPR
ncbi:tetratricopeptide repeat protein [Singulisphaera acidiphila]|uniref:Tetratricopeptide repeat protein n=1 Tax=Singulisphaera acidiphila (strain ATCC BAA-1392 / DSM 18658 / VKM B-2454 / MOB10) TaxID=886293 RepID=L0DI07_SINAD|nr:hypothetical protein [Singulisphaera acidiphila]AGA28485.1 hypothetical protein Sinac_4286 [Singulisphaera acidiphila DSM 18658]